MWRSTGPSTVVPVWMADAVRPSRPGLWRCGSAVKMGRCFPRTSWWSSPANATTTAHMPTRQLFPSTGCSMTFTNLGTKCYLGFQHKGGQIGEKSARITETWVGAVGVKGLIVEGMHCSFSSSIKVFRNCLVCWCRWTLRQPRLENTLLHNIGAHVTASFWSLWCWGRSVFCL